MMAYEMRELNGSLFKNDKKEQGTNQRDYNGSCLINGVEMWISAWLKTSANGQNYMSLSFEPKQQQQAPPRQNQGYQQPQQQNQGYQQPQPPQNQSNQGYQQPPQQPQQQQQQPNNGGDYTPPFSPTEDIPF
jgi:hypothetical protein